MNKEELQIILEACLLKQDTLIDEEIINLCSKYPVNLVIIGIKLNKFLQEKIQ